MKKLEKMSDREFVEVLKKTEVEKEPEKIENTEETWGTEKEKAYNKKIKPLLKQINSICNDNEIQHLSVFGLGGGENRNTAVEINGIDEEDTDYNPLIKAAEDIVYYREENKIITKYVELIRDLVASYGFSSENRFERLTSIRHPKIGDLVIEHSNPYSSLNSIGTLLEVNEEVPMKEYKIKTLDGRTVSWSNAGFYTIPKDKF